MWTEHRQPNRISFISINNNAYSISRIIEFFGSISLDFWYIESNKNHILFVASGPNKCPVSKQLGARQQIRLAVKRNFVL